MVPPGSEVVVMASAVGLILMLTVPVALADIESPSMTWKVKEPAVVGVPEMVPEEATVNPPGKLLPVPNRQAYGGVPPVAARACE